MSRPFGGEWIEIGDSQRMTGRCEGRRNATPLALRYPAGRAPSLPNP
jgi:hypothetical protein